MSAIAIVLGFFVAVAMFFLAAYLLMLSYNASVPVLFSGANYVDNYWTFVIFAIFVAILGTFLSPFAGILGGLGRRGRVITRRVS